MPCEPVADDDAHEAGQSTLVRGGDLLEPVNVCGIQVNTDELLTWSFRSSQSTLLTTAVVV